MGSSSEPDFSAMDEALRTAGLLGEPAEIHGEYCGLACVMGADAAPAWVASTLAGSDGVAGNIRDLLQSLAMTTWQALDSGDMALKLLLPGDDERMAARAESLGLWCQGFMHGLGAGSDPGPDSPLLANDVTREIIADFSEITRAAFTTDETEAEAEAAYIELVEFVRVSVQLAFEELSMLRMPPKSELRH